MSIEAMIVIVCDATFVEVCEIVCRCHYSRVAFPAFLAERKAVANH